MSFTDFFSGVKALPLAADKAVKSYLSHGEGYGEFSPYQSVKRSGS